MKKLILLQLIISIFYFVTAQNANVKKLPAGKAPVIDGIVENFWDTVTQNNLNKTVLNEIPTLTSYWKSVWNDTALFIVVSVTDNYHCDVWCSNAQDWLSDKIEIYIDANSVLKDSIGPSTYPNGHFQFAPGFEYNKTQYSFKGNGWQGYYFYYAYKITGTNYVFEYAIPWSSLIDKYDQTGTPLSQYNIGFDVCVADRDSANDYRRRAVWANNASVAENWFNMDSSGVMNLVNHTQNLKVISPSNKILSSGSTYNFSTKSNLKKEFILKNTGIKNLNISSINISGTGYSLVKSNKTSLGLLDTMILRVNFSENASNNFQGTLTINSNDANNSTYTINLNATKATAIEGGIISGIWTKANSPYNIYGNIIIPKDSTLKIEPGVSVIFQGYYNLKVNGSLLALGSKTDSIRFTINDTTNFYVKNSPSGGWNGINLWNNKDSSKFMYCIIDHSKTYNGDGGAIYVQDLSKLLISHSVIRNNCAQNSAGAMQIAGGGAIVTITDTKFLYNSCSYDGGAIRTINNSKTNILNCIFYGNAANYGGAITNCCNSYTYMSNSILSNNTANDVGGAIYLVVSNSFYINNVITNNNANGSGGGAITINNCQPYFYNNNICYNKGNNNASAILIWDISPGTFINNIIWGNTSNSGSKFQIDLTAGTPLFNNCIIEGGFASVQKFGVYKLDTTTIFNSNPNFTGAPTKSGNEFNGLTANWNVSNKSITINKGTAISPDMLKIKKDIYNNNRILHGAIDIGAIETHIASSNVSGIIMHDTIWVSDTVRVTNNLKLTDSASLTIAPGTVVQFQGHYSFKVEGLLKSIGLPDAPIKFTIKDTTGFSKKDTSLGSWNGISLNNSCAGGACYKMPANDSIILDHTIIEYAKNMDGNWDQTIGGGIQIKYYSNVRISNCEIRYNYANRGGGINIDGFSNPVVRNNKIYNNKATNSGGGICISGNSNPLILNNFVCNNVGNTGGIYVETSNPIIVSNVINNNHSIANAGGVCLILSYPVFSCNTIANNLAEWEGGGLCAFDCNPKIFNTIIWGNQAHSGMGGIATYDHPILYNCLIENGENNISNVYNVEIHNLYKGDPGFKNPSKTYSIAKDGLTADWSITTFSNAIDSGALNFGYPLVTDIIGNKRINNETIDIGAYENQGSKLQILKQPIGKQLCAGDTITLTVLVSDTAKFQWQKEGNYLINNTSRTLRISNVNELSQGNYICAVSNAYGKIYSSPVYVEVRNAPKIIYQTLPELVGDSTEYKIEVNVSGDEPLKYRWMKNNVILPTDTSDIIDIPSFTLKNEGTYMCTISNSCGSISSVPASINIAPEICLVTVETSGDIAKNIIVWEKNSKETYKQFNIYREGTASGHYVKIGQVPYSSPSKFIDNTAKPKSRAYMYKITATKTNNIETPLKVSKPHKTIHLLVTEGVPTGIQLDWDEYVGIDYGTYNIYKSTNNGEFKLVETLPTTNTTWTDFDASASDYLQYFVAVKSPRKCNTDKTIKKAGGGVYVQAVSNMEDNRLRSTSINDQVFSNAEIDFAPNPFKSNTNLAINLKKPENVAVKIIDIKGIVMNEFQSERVFSGNKQISFGENYIPGVYFVIISIGNENKAFKILKLN